MKSSEKVREELVSGIENKYLSDLRTDARVLKNYGFLSFEDYYKVRAAIVEEIKVRKQSIL